MGHLVRRDRPPAGAGQAHQAARPEPGPVRAIAGDRLGHGLLLAEPAADRGRAGRDVHGHQPRDAGRRSNATRRRSGWRSRPRPATPPSCRSRTRASTSCSATPCCITCPISTAPSPSSCACCAPGGMLFFAGEPSRHGDRIAAYPKRAAIKAAPLWRKALRARPAPTHHGAPDEDEHALEAVVDVHAFVPADIERHATQAGFADVRVRGEELLANWFGWFNRTLEATADPKDIPRGLDPVRLPRLPAAPARGPRAARAAPAAADLLQPDAGRAQARVSPSQSTHPARSTCCATSARSSTPGSGPSPSSPPTRSGT